jgi:hypothetical protein
VLYTDMAGRGAAYAKRHLFFRIFEKSTFHTVSRLVRPP